MNHIVLKVIAVLLPLVGAFLDGILLPMNRGDWVNTLNKPSWAPPNWLFGPVWTVLYCAMGYASYLVYQACGGFTAKATLPLTLYGVQLLLNWAWPPIFFYYHQIELAFYEIVTLTVLVALCVATFWRVKPAAGYIMLPYLAWLCFASALNYSIWKLNEGMQFSEVNRVRVDRFY